MRLTEIAMIAADTSRSKAYLQALVRHDLLPNHVILMQNPTSTSLPGQIAADDRVSNLAVSESDSCWSEALFDVNEPLAVTASRAGVSSQSAASNNINDESNVELIRQRPEGVFIYSGFGGAILRKEILTTGKRFLHVHGGYLPDYKGSTTNYYSLLAENLFGASSLFLTAEIDSGPVLIRKKFPVPHDRLKIDHVYDPAARAKVLVQTLLAFVRLGRWAYELSDNSGGETYFVIHPVLKHYATL